MRRLASAAFALRVAAVGLARGWALARKCDDPHLEVSETSSAEGSELPTPTVSFSDTMTSVEMAHYNGFVAGVCWAILTPDEFDDLAAGRDLTDEGFCRMAGEFANRATDQAAAGAIADGKMGPIDPEVFAELSIR